ARYSPRVQFGIDGLEGAAGGDLRQMSRGRKRTVRRLRPASGPVELRARRGAVVGEPVLLAADPGLLRLLRPAQRALVLAHAKGRTPMSPTAAATLDVEPVPLPPAAVQVIVPLHVFRFDAKSRWLHMIVMTTFLGLSAT